jgi:methionyl-tRNA synthetase
MKTLWKLAILWTLPWKGIALWKASRNNQKGWYIAMLILQTLGVLEILYLLFFKRNKNMGLRPYNMP